MQEYIENKLKEMTAAELVEAQAFITNRLLDIQKAHSRKAIITGLPNSESASEQVNLRFAGMTNNYLEIVKCAPETEDWMAYTTASAGLECTPELTAWRDNILAEVPIGSVIILDGNSCLLKIVDGDINTISKKLNYDSFYETTGNDFVSTVLNVKLSYKETKAEEKSETRYLCITKCMENDDTDSGLPARHCVATMQQRLDREEVNHDYCPCGNRDKWLTMKEASASTDPYVKEVYLRNFR